MHTDDENNEVFSKEILDDVNEIFGTMQAKNDNSEDESDHAIAEADAQFLEPAEDNVNFGGFELMYEKVLEAEGQLLCPVVQAQVGDDYNELKNSFERFQRKLRQMILESKRKNGSVMQKLLSPLLS